MQPIGKEKLITAQNAHEGISPSSRIPSGQEEVKPSATKGCRTIIIILMILLVGIIIGLLSSRPQNVTGEVASVSWQRSIAVEEQRSVQYEDWKENIPAGAVIGSCTMRQSGVQDVPAANATKVCGTPYSIKLNSGHAEVRQDCAYYVYSDYCHYTVTEWVVVETLRAQGSDYSPMWPQVSLASSQREGARSEVYTITFRTNDKVYTLTTDDVSTLNACQPGTSWRLVVSGDKVVSISPG